MSEPFLAEIRILSFNFPPKGWAQCNGQLLPINQNQALFALLGTQYGGNGQTTFALPNLRGRTPIHSSVARLPGYSGGSAQHTVNSAELPMHTHSLNGLTADAASRISAAQMPAHGRDEYVAVGETANVTAAAAAIANAGGSQPHNNMQPYLTLNFCIALQGLFPSQT